MTQYFQTHGGASVVTGTQMAVARADEVTGVVGVMNSMGLARCESMELTNDPRFFSSNVIDKRLGAFGKLSIVAGLMLGTSMGQLFKLKKNMNFDKCDLEGGCVGYIQFVGFVLEMLVVFMCLISLYVICHQLFYTYRLMTTGPTGFELASMFYLTRSIVMWRHFAIKCLLNGLALFMVSSGLTLYVKFIKDAEGGPAKILVVNMKDGTSVNDVIGSGADIDPTLDITTHVILAYCVLACFVCCAVLLCVIRTHHLSAFRELYMKAQTGTAPLTQTLLQMAHRNRMASPDT